MLELWNKLHFEEQKRRVYIVFRILSTIFVEFIYKMQNLEDSGAVRPL